MFIAVPYLARWVIHPRAAWADMRDPIVDPLHGTFPGGILVLGMAISTVEPLQSSRRPRRKERSHKRYTP